MPQTKTTTRSKKQGTSSEILKELRRLNDQVEDLHDFLEMAHKKQKSRRLINGFLGGLARVFGILLGTLLLAGLIYLGGRMLVQSGTVQGWIQEAVQNSIEDATLGASESALEILSP